MDGNRLAGVKLLVFTNPKTGREDEYNEWYNTTHLNDLRAIPGVAGAARYRLRTPDVEVMGQPDFKYLAIYELDGDLDTVMKEMRARSADGRMYVSDALDTDHVLMGAYEPL
jgi:hypothetical protein